MFIPLILTIIGLTLLLAGLFLLRGGLAKYLGPALPQILLRFTETPGKGFCSGLVATGILQSSTALTLMAVAFVDTGLLNFTKALGLILGSNVGATLTTQLLALPVAKLAKWVILPGLTGYLLLKSRLRFLLLAVSGLGMMFFSLAVLGSAMLPLTRLTAVQAMLAHLGDHYLASVLCGTVLAALLHSSSAATGIVMVLTQEGRLNLPASFAFIIGANIGTCCTALIVAIFTSRAAQRVAIFHFLLNVFGALLFFPFLPLLAAAVSQLGMNPSREIAMMHTVFNLVSSLIVLPLLPYAARLLQKLRS
jgi:phosphate:Na+ symporter